MDGAPHQNSSRLKVLFVILSSIVESPVLDVILFVELTLWAGRASEPCAAAHNEPSLAIKVRPYCPVAPARFNKEEAARSSLLFEDLRENKLRFTTYK